MMQRSYRMGVAALAAGCLTVLSVSPALAGRRKTTIIATVDGTAMKWKGRLASISQNGSGVFIIASKRARRGKILPTIGFGCAVDLFAQTYPFTMTLGCTANYTETRVGGSFETKSWLALGEATTVTFESFDGTRVTGTITSTLDPVVAPGPITIDGTFSGKVIAAEN